MTTAEYRRLYRQARKNLPEYQSETMSRIIDVYQDAARSAAEEVRKATLSGQSDLTIDSWRQIEQQLRSGADDISTAIEKEIPQMVTDSYWNEPFPVDNDYLKQAVSRAGAGNRITEAGIRNMGIGVNNRMIRALVSRNYADGYTFSQRIWGQFKENGLPLGINGDYQYRIKNLINAGLASNRDVVKIAKDIELYVKADYLKRGIDTKDLVFNPGRYGKLVPGSGEYRRRVSGKPDWRALRLVRSELYSSLQMASIEQGRLNPASRGLYDWYKTPGNPIDPDGSRNASGLRCIDLEDGNPYTLETVPGYQHSNCSCSVIPHLMDGNEFVSDLTDWANFEPVDYLDEWYLEHYLPFQ